MKVLVTGAKGQLGADLMNELEKRGLDSIGVDAVSYTHLQKRTDRRKRCSTD